MIDWTKPIRCTDGRAARHLGKLFTHAARPFVVATLGPDGEFVAYANADGDCGPTTIENIPERTVRWRWLLVGQEFGVESERAAREIAHKWGESARVARIEYENGRAVKVELEP